MHFCTTIMIRNCFLPLKKLSPYWCLAEWISRRLSPLCFAGIFQKLAQQVPTASLFLIIPFSRLDYVV